MNIEDPLYLRELCRNNEFISKTSGLCNNYIHTNIIILPQKYAEDFTKIGELEKRRFLSLFSLNNLLCLI